MYIACKNNLITCSLEDVTNYEILHLPERPTALHAIGDIVYIGFESGKISLYSLVTKKVQT